MTESAFSYMLRKQAALPAMLLSGAKWLGMNWALPAAMGGLASGATAEGSLSDKIRAGGETILTEMFNPTRAMSNIVSWGLLGEAAGQGTKYLTKGNKALWAKYLPTVASVATGFAAGKFLDPAFGVKEDSEPGMGLDPEAHANQSYRARGY